MRKVADLVVSTGRYTTAQGVEKQRYMNVGVRMQNDDGTTFILLNRTFNPAGVPNPDNRDNVMIREFSGERKEFGGERNDAYYSPPEKNDYRGQKARDATPYDF